MSEAIQGLFSEALKHHQSGDLTGAERFYRQILAMDARHADSLHLLGVLAQQGGHHEDAIALMRQAIAIKDDIPSFYNTLGTALMASKKLDDAAAQFMRALDIDPDYVAACNNLGYVLQALGRIDDAVACYERALALDPEHPQTHNNLGYALQARGGLAEAMTHYERAIALKPDYAQAHNNMGNALHDLGRFDEAAACYERAIAIKPDFAEAHNNMGTTMRALNRFDDAVACYERAIAVKSDFAEAHNNLGYVLQMRGRHDEAMACYQRTLAINPDHVGALNNLGIALVRHGRLAEAAACYERAIAVKPDYAEARNNLGNVHKMRGDFDGALAQYDQVLAIKPDHAEAHLNRADILTFHAGGADLAALENLVAGVDSLPVNNAIYLHFTYARALEDAGDYDRAFEHLRKGNALKRRHISYDGPAISRSYGRIAQAFDAGIFERLRGVGDPSSVPVFVIGMPRSGSTLIAQILSSHPQIHAAGELTHMDAAIDSVFGAAGNQAPYPECVPALTAAALRRLGEAYLARLPAPPEGKVRVIDKLPGNFINAGLIPLALPNARIIHARRDPIDTCVSCFSILFREGQDFTYDMEELGRYYRDYDALMAHWRSVLPPDAMIEVSYEDVIDDLEGQARRLIDYCGLPWDKSCLEFQKNKRVVSTASAVQVRQPLYRDSLQRWRRYESHLAPLLRALGDYARPGNGQSQ